MSNSFQRICLVVQSTHQRNGEVISAICACLQPLGAEIFLYCHSQLHDISTPASLTPVAKIEKGSFDLLLVVGGDGSMLKTIRETHHCATPYMGVDLGQVGFLQDIAVAELAQQLQQVYRGQCKKSRRTLIEAVITDAKTPTKVINHCVALNEIALRASNLRMVDLLLSFGNEFRHRFTGDGILFSTPTGSTGYALSAGGPIVYPTMPAICVIPINAHMIFSRPVIAEDSTQFHVYVGARNPSIHVHYDGQPFAVLTREQRITIKKHKNSIELVHLFDDSFYQTCHSKLGWGRLGKRSMD